MELSYIFTTEYNLQKVYSYVYHTITYQSFTDPALNELTDILGMFNVIHIILKIFCFNSAILTKAVYRVKTK